MTKRQLKLEVELNLDFQVAGIISGFRNYRICHGINRRLGIKLVRMKDVEIPAGRPGSSTKHSVYSYEEDETMRGLFVSNKDNENAGFLIPELKNVDYFLIMEGSWCGEMFDKCVREIRELDTVTGVYELNASELKSGEAFLLVLDT